MMNLKKIKILEILLVLILMFFIVQTINASDLSITANNYNIFNGGHFNFDNIAPANRKQAVTFIIKNNTDKTIRLNGVPRVVLTMINGSTSDFTKNDSSVSDLQPWGTCSFTIAYTSTATSGAIKRARITINNDSNDGPIVFTISCTDMSNGSITFYNVGTQYWRSPCYGTASVTLVGGGGGGGGSASGYLLYNGGGGGGAGQRLSSSFSLNLNGVYTIIVGNGGIHGSGGSKDDDKVHTGETGDTGQNTQIIYNNSVIVNASGGAGGQGGGLNYPSVSNGGSGYPGGKPGIADDSAGDGGDGGNNNGGYGEGKESGDLEGHDGGAAPDYSGGGGGGASGADSKRSGNPGGNGGSGLVIISWTGWLL